MRSKQSRNMASRSTRNKLKSQGQSVLDDLERAMNHLVQIAALADDRSEYIDKHLPILITYLEMVTKAVKQFREGF